jgi:hypothetical protein
LHDQVVEHDGKTPSADFKQSLVVPAIVDDKVQAVLSFYCESDSWPNKSIVEDFSGLPGAMIQVQPPVPLTSPHLHHHHYYCCHCHNLHPPPPPLPQQQP